MAMSSGTMSNNPNDWLQFYTQNLNSSTPPMFTHDQVSADATVVTAIATTATTSPSGQPRQTAAAVGHPGSSTNNNSSLSPDQGRVSKPVRKRSRASRRTPTTLLNTDTSNFRAMVQQFTGGPSTASFPTGASTFGFGLGPTRSQSFVVPPGYHPLQPQQQQHVQQLQQQQQFQQQRQNQQYLLSLNNNGGGGGGGGDGFLERLSSSSRVVGSTANMGMTSSDDHEFLREGVSSQVPSGARRPSGNENRSNSFMF